MKPMQVSGWLLVVLGGMWGSTAIVSWLAEVRFLSRVLRSILPNGRIREREDLVRLKNYLSSHIRYDRTRLNEARPLLRASARHTLTRGHGFCGENARVAMWLLALGGVRAHRVYLEATRWKHILLEHRWEGGWKFFDAHADPATLLPDDAVGRIESVDLTGLPNGHEGNAYLRSYRLRPLHGLALLRRFEQTRLPWAIVLFLESPSLMQAAAGFVVLAAGLVLAGLG